MTVKRVTLADLRDLHEKTEWQLAHSPSFHKSLVLERRLKKIGRRIAHKTRQIAIEALAEAA